MSITINKTSAVGIEIDDLSAIDDEIYNGQISISSDGILMKSSLNKNEIPMVKSSFMYTVKPGDTLNDISKKYGISIETIRHVNNLSNNNISIGNEILIPATDGITYTINKNDTIDKIAENYNISKESILAYNEQSLFRSGDVIFLPHAKPKEEPKIIVKNINNNKKTNINNKRRVINITSDKAYISSSYTNMIMPADGVVTQRFHRGHYAIDIAKKGGATVYAAQDGVVVDVSTWGWNYGYGNFITIDHGNGISTMYAHLSKVYVSPGQYVSAKTPIGYMGSSGRSSGTHLHFEVILNGRKQNPFAYIK